LQAINNPSQSLVFRDSSPADNVVDLSLYRSWHRPRRPLKAVNAKQTKYDVESSEEYFERMKVNVAVFLLLSFLVFIGTWLLNGITEATHHFI